MNSSTKTSLVAAAVAAALSVNANAYTPPRTPAQDAAITQWYYAGGGSAEAQAVYSAVQDLLANIDVYTESTDTTYPQSGTYLIVTGTAKQQLSGVASGSLVGFMYKYGTAGGVSSGSMDNGARPSYTGGSLPYPAPSSLNPATVVAQPAQAPAAAYPSSLYPNYKFTLPTSFVNHTPDWGITDTEVELLNFKANLNNEAALSLTGASETPAYVAPFGVAVTANIFTNKHYFSKSEIAGILAGTITDWNQLTGDNGSPLAAGAIYLLDRGSGSGTKASGNQYFLNYPSGLSTTHQPAIAPNSLGGSGFATSNVNAGYVAQATIPAYITANGTPSSGLIDIKEGSSETIVEDLQYAYSHSLSGAIAILGLEFPPVYAQVSAGTNPYDFVAVAGSYPDAETGNDYVNNPASGAKTQYSHVISGSYDFAYQTAFIVPNSSTVVSGQTGSAPTSTTTFEQGLYYYLSQPSISGANTGSAFPASAAGVLLDPNTTGAVAGAVNWTRGADSQSAPIWSLTPAVAAADPL